MGRVAKYKKIRACDPFAKRSTRERSGLTIGAGAEALDPRRKASLRKRERRARKRPKKREKRRGEDFDGGLDAPPSEKDDFDLSDPSLTVRREKRRPANPLLETTTTTTAAVASSGPALACHIPADDKEEARVARELNATADGAGGASNAASKRVERITSGRKEGESMRAFKKRVDEETRQILLREAAAKNATRKRSAAKEEKKRAYLNKRKTMKKGKRKGKFQQNDDYDDDDGGLVVVTKGLVEQAERPPVFSALPRGAKRKDDRKNQDGEGRSRMDEDKQAKERRSMEIMRDRVVASYALIKAKRRQERA